MRQTGSVGAKGGVGRGQKPEVINFLSPILPIAPDPHWALPRFANVGAPSSPSPSSFHSPPPYLAPTRPLCLSKAIVLGSRPRKVLNTSIGCLPPPSASTVFR